MIYNRERFEQRIDYDGFPLFASDIDSITNFKGRLWLANETKVEGRSVSRGQEITIKEFVEQLGTSQTTFFLVTHHDTKASEDITGDKMLVSTVYFKAPHIPRLQVYDYEPDERPTYNKFCLMLALACDLESKLKAGHEVDWLLNVLDPLMQKYRFDDVNRKTLTNPEMMESFVVMDDWDDFTDEQRAFMWSCKIYDELDFYANAFLPWTELSEKREYQK